MTSSLLDDAFAHHTWATLQVMDACAALGTALTSLGIEPPEIGVWEYGATVDRAGDAPADS